MFSYVDKKIREKLKTDRRLVTLDREGAVVDPSNDDKPYISILGPIPIPITIRGEGRILDWYAFVRRMELSNVLDAAGKVGGDGDEEAFRELLQANMSVNSVLASPGFLDHPNPLVRIHSCCLTGEVFGSTRCDCGPQLETAFDRIFEEKGGGVVYMSSHEGRGIGLWAKAITYLLQDDGQDTYQANVSLGLPEDSRDFTDAAVVLRYLLKGKSIRLFSNNPIKKAQLEAGGQPVEKMVPYIVGLSRHNERYLESKRKKGHLITDA
jgi:GTP cyclohydrolase II